MVSVWALMAGLLVGVLVGYFMESDDAEQDALEHLEAATDALLAIPSAPCPHCGKMRGDPVERDCVRGDPGVTAANLTIKCAGAAVVLWNG